MIPQLLRSLGLVSRGELDATLAKLRSVREKLDTAQKQLATAAATATQQQRSHSTTIEKYQAKLAALEAAREGDAARARHAAARASERVAQLERELEKRNTQLLKIAQEATALESRVLTSVEDLDVAREQLLAVEMKMNLLESAVNMLDARMKKSRSSEPDGSR